MATGMFRALAKYIDSLLERRCPGCDSVSYTSEFVFVPNSITLFWRPVAACPTYKHHCSNCQKEWFD